MNTKAFKPAAALALSALLAACAGFELGGFGKTRTQMTLAPADAATQLMITAPLTMALATPSRAPRNGQDPLVELTLTHADGRALEFQEANHTPNDVMAQAPGGPLAQVMGFFGQEAPTLYRASEQAAAPFLCGPEGPALLGFYEAPGGGAVTMVGLKRDFDFETLPNGETQALPYSPDQVCARLKLNAVR